MKEVAILRKLVTEYRWRVKRSTFGKIRDFCTYTTCNFTCTRTFVLALLVLLLALGRLYFENMKEFQGSCDPLQTNGDRIRLKSD